VSTALVLLAAGSGTRVGADVNKVLLPLGDTTVLGHSVATALAVSDVHRIVLVVRAGEEQAVAESVVPLLGRGEAIVVTGGASRHASEQAALAVLRADIEAGEVDVVAIHDTARPLATPQLFTAVIETARTQGGAVPAAPLTHLLTRRLQPVAADAALVGVQTPQAFRAGELLAAYDRAAGDGFEGTDTAACLERYRPGLRIVAVPSSSLNLKVTFAEDLPTVETLLADG